MVILMSPDAQGRITLGRKVLRDTQYAVDVDGDGVVTLTPSVVLSKREFEALMPVRPVLSPEEAFGRRGAIEAASAVQENMRARGIGGTRIRTAQALHDLIWSGAA
jgi:hypothetical protein